MSSEKKSYYKAVYSYNDIAEINRYLAMGSQPV